MKKLLIITGLSLLTSISSAWAQSSANTQSNTDKKSSSSVNKASQANNSQLKGLGVPYKKEKQQFGKSISTRKNRPGLPSTVSTGPGVSDAAKKGTTPGSHVAQREMKIGHQTSAKTGSTSSKTLKP